MAEAAKTYADEQTKLQRQYEGAVDEDNLHIDVPQEPEVNPEVYKDVEPILFRGFLHVPAEINEVRFVFKSLNHHEFELLNFCTGGLRNDHKSVQRFYNLFLAYGVFMVDGISVFRDRERWLPQIAEMFESLNVEARKKVIRYLSDINRRASRAVVLTEAYAMETVSRLRWAQFKGMDVTSPSVTGVVGTETLGMNWGQLTWRALNHFEDTKDQTEREWEDAKFIASSMAGKGMSRVHNQDRERRKKEREERMERKDRILRFAVLGEPLDSDKSGAVPVKVARTVEELADQLERDLKGDKDWHDMVVDAHEQKVRDQYQQRQDRVRTLQETYAEKYGERPMVAETDLKGLTPDEVKFRIDRRRQLTAQRLSAQQVFPELHDPKMASFVEKYVQIERTDRDPSKVPQVVVPERPRGVPFRRGK
jgi:hypothetical protein